MSDTQYDRRYTEPYDTVELMIPLTEKLRTAGLKAAVITADGKFTALDARIEGDYLVLPTSDMGDFVFYTAEGEFDWTYDPGAIGPNAKPGPQTGQTVAGALWSFGCLILSGLVLYFTVIKGRKNAV